MLYPPPWLAQAGGSSTANTRSLESLLEILGEFAVPLAIWFLLTQAIGILVSWAASRVVNTGENGTLGNAIKVYLFSLLAVVIAPILLIGTERVTGSGAATVCVAVVYSIFILFGIPMKVYDIGFGRALGWLLLSVLFNVVAGFVISLPFGASSQQLSDRLAGRRSANSSPEEVPTAAPTPTRAPVERAPNPPPSPEDRVGRFEAQERLAGDQARPQTERLAALTEMYRQLEQERLSLPPGDDAARAAFDQRRARYDAALQKLRAEQPTPRPTRRPAK